MLPAILDLVTFAIGLLIGFYERTIYDKINSLVEQRREAQLAKEVGVVRPIGIPITKNQPIDMTSETGPVMRPSPAKVEDQRQDERAKVLRENHQ